MHKLMTLQTLAALGGERFGFWISVFIGPYQSRDFRRLTTGVCVLTTPQIRLAAKSVFWRDGPEFFYST